uniref:Uncharacterized protein n=1 Tax=Ipomoea trifida TaxID=35884 RepID=A0PAB9_IPOTF|nr:hypothetical protein [Ipomoea trifida]
MSDENVVMDQDLPKDTVDEMEVDKDANGMETEGEETTNDDSKEELELRTPESEKNKIPAIDDCPPPPAKQRRTRSGKAGESSEPATEEEMEFMDSEMGGQDDRFSLKKRLFVDPPTVNDKKE